MTARLALQMLGAWSVLHEVDVMGTKDVIACCVRDVIQPFLSKWVPLTLVQAVFCLSEL